MERRAVGALLAVLCAVGVLLGVPVPAADAAGSGTLLPTDAACSNSGNCRPSIEWRTSSYGPVAAGETQIRRRTLWSVYAQAGEQILSGSSSVGLLRPDGSGLEAYADVVIWDPGVVTDTEAATLPAVVHGTNGFLCTAQRAATGNALQGRIVTRGQEKAGPRSVDGTANPAGYEPCVYTAPRTGIYRVAFYGTAGGNTNAQTTVYGGIGGADSQTFAPPSLVVPWSSAVEAWDVTVRAGSGSSTTALAGRLFTYAIAGFSGDNGRPVDMALHLTTDDGYRYTLDTQGFDPNGFVLYGNSVGFLDAQGRPLYHDVLGTRVDDAGGNPLNPSFLNDLAGGTQLAAPEYPLSLEQLAPETLAALGYAPSAVPPDLAGLTFTGPGPGDQTYPGSGGTFTLHGATAGTYQIVISAGGSFDPRAGANRVLRGVVSAGDSVVTWDGRDNVGQPVPVGAGYQAHATMQAGVVHVPMLDVESSKNGGPSIVLTNPPGGICPFGRATCSTAFYDDRGYVTNGTTIGTVDGSLCPPTPTQTFAGTSPASVPLSSDPVDGYDSLTTARAYGAAYKISGSAHPPVGGVYCDSRYYTLGDTRGLDVWTHYPSTLRPTLVDVVAPPPVPDAVDDAVTVPAGTSSTRSLLTNDTGTRITVTAATPATHGTATVGADGTLGYRPADGWSGPDSVTYTVTDAAGQTDTATVRVRVTPVAGDDALTALSGSSAFVAAGQLTGNDVGSGLTLTSVSATGRGPAVLTGGTITYTPPADFSGTDTVTVTVVDAHAADGQGAATSTVTVTVLPDAVDDDLAVRADRPTSTADGALLDDDRGTGLSVTSWTQPRHGSVSVSPGGRVTVVPAAGLTGIDGFTYTVTDAAGRTDTAAVRFTVAPAVGVESLVMRAGTTLTVGDGVLRGDDPGPGLLVTGAAPTTQHDHGTVRVADGVLTYVPPPTFSGAQDVAYSVADANGATVTFPLRISVLPRAVEDMLVHAPGSPVSVSSAALVANDLGVGLAFSSVTRPGHGTVTRAADGTLTYTPDTGWSGGDAFSYTVLDEAAAASTATVTVTVLVPADADVPAPPTRGRR